MPQQAVGKGMGLCIKKSDWLSLAEVAAPQCTGSASQWVHYLMLPGMILHHIRVNQACPAQVQSSM